MKDGIFVLREGVEEKKLERAEREPKYLVIQARQVFHED